MTPRPAPQPTAPPVTQAPLGSAFGPPAHSPDHLDFGEVWDGESSFKTVSFTTQNAGLVRVEIPPGPFYVAQIRELGPPKMGSKNSPQPVQVTATQETKGTITFIEGQPSPWTYNAVGAGNQLQVSVVFKPKWDMSTMNAGPKSSSMKISGPGVTVPWTMSVPLSAMFDGKHTMPVVTLPEKQIVAPVASFEQASFTVRVTAAGEDVGGNFVFPSLAPGLTKTGGPYVHVSGSETKEFQIAVQGTGGHSDTPLDGTIALEFTRTGQSIKQQTPPVGFQVIFVPQAVNKSLGSKTCNGVQIRNASLTVSAGGQAEFAGDFYGVTPEIHFEVFFPQANRTLMHTNGQVSNTGRGPVMLPSVRAEENSQMKGVSADYAGYGIRFSAYIDPGPKDTLNRYRALLHSSAELRCW